MAVVVFIYGTFSNTHNTLEVGFKTPRMYNAVRFTDARDAPALKKRNMLLFITCVCRGTLHGPLQLVSLGTPTWSLQPQVLRTAVLQVLFFQQEAIDLP